MTWWQQLLLTCTAPVVTTLVVAAVIFRRDRRRSDAWSRAQQTRRALELAEQRARHERELRQARERRAS